jgi:Coagulation Factor Xa inhibitory site
VLSPDKKACIDIDECTAGDSLSGPCSQTCTNTRGSYKCGCVENFLLAEDRITCKAETDPLLLYGSDSQVNWITPDGRHQGVVTEGHHAYITVGLDYLEENHMTSVSFLSFSWLHTPQTDFKALDFVCRSSSQIRKRERFVRSSWKRNRR